MWNLVLVHLKIVLTSVQDSCMVCAKRTMGLESFWMPAMVLLDDEAEVEARFRPFGDSANRTIGSEIVLDAPDGTPRRRGSCGILFRSVWRLC
jgi:hypothetical protein